MTHDKNIKWPKILLDRQLYPLYPDGVPMRFPRSKGGDFHGQEGQRQEVLNALPGRSVGKTERPE